MAIGTATALALGTAALSAGTSALSASAQKKAANKAAGVAADTTAANNALTREIYGLNTANFQPWMASGLRANNAIEELLLGRSGPIASATPPSPVPSALSSSGAAQPSAFGAYGPPAAEDPRDLGWFGGTRDARVPASMAGNYALPGMPADTTPTAPMQGAVTAAAPPSARSAFDQYLESTGYRFRFDEGMKGLNINAGARGMLESGARDKAAIRFGQGIASDEFSRYIALLDNQQRLGFGSASALAGVGQNMVGNVTANNNMGANAAANAALYAGGANAGMWGNIGSAFGTALGQLGSSYKRFGW